MFPLAGLSGVPYVSGDLAPPSGAPSAALVGDVTAHPALLDGVARAGVRPVAFGVLPDLTRLPGIALVVLDGDAEVLGGFRSLTAAREGASGRPLPVLLVFRRPPPDTLPAGAGVAALGPHDSATVAADRIRALLRGAETPVAGPDEAPSAPRAELLDAMVRALPIGLAVVSPGGEIRFANPAFETMLGGDAGAPSQERFGALRAVGSPDRPLLERVPSDGRAWEGDVRMPGPDGGREFTATLRRLDGGGPSSTILMVLREVTRMRMLERRLADAQRMEAVGQLAGGVAHDFNNILSVITTLSDLLIRLRPDDDPDREDLEEILRSARRGSEITRQLSAFSRTGAGEPDELDLDTVLRNNEKMFRRLLPEDVELIWDLQGDLPVVRADPVQIDQMILNLSLNARDAMPDGGTLRIATERRTLDRPHDVDGSQLPAGTYAVIDVQDSGEGMDEGTRRRIFEPFFTTRGWGRRSGLGLSVVYGTVHAAGGGIEVESAPGAGTRFRIYLPAHRASATPGPEAELPRGEETVLVVEDHVELRKGVRRFLTELGYRVMDAADGAEALALVKDGGLRPHLIATDVVMPALSGSELEAEVRALGLSVPVLFFSGYTDHPEVDRLRRAGVRVFPKPVDMEHLAREVRAVLDRHGALPP